MSKQNKGFLARAFEDMKESAKAQHEVDKANFAAVREENKAKWEEMKAMNNPRMAHERMQAERNEKIASAKQRITEAQQRIDTAKAIKQ